MTGMRLQYKMDPCPPWDVNEVARLPVDNWGTLSLALWNRVAFTVTLPTCGHFSYLGHPPSRPPLPTCGDLFHRTVF